jgi:hypothetical protein
VSATYRIEVSEAPDPALWPFEAKIVRLSDDWPVRVERRSTAHDAELAAKRWIQRDSANPLSIPRVVYVDDQGRDAEAPQSVKV